MRHKESDFIYSNTVAARLGISNNSLGRMVLHDQFPRPVKAPSGVIAWHRADVEAWEDLRH